MLKDVAPKARKSTTANARGLRRKMTLPEVIVWHWLRQRPEGLKFRRQHPTGPYILDFFCSDARFAIEIDGESHALGDRPQRDAVRDEWLSKSGIYTLRISARDVFENADGVFRSILAEATARLPLHHPAAPGGPPPRHKLGED